MASTLGARLRRLREAKKLTLQQVADAVGCTKAYIWELEMKEGQRPSAERIHLLAKVLGVTMEDLMNETNEQVPEATVEDVAFFRQYLKYEWRSRSAVLSNTRIRRLSDPAEPLRDTVAADESIAQEWNGIDMSAAVWCVGEQPYMKLQEFKHSYGGRDRVLTLLILEDAEPRRWDNSWQDQESFDSVDQFNRG